MFFFFGKIPLEYPSQRLRGTRFPVQRGPRGGARPTSPSGIGESVGQGWLVQARFRNSAPRFEPDFGTTGPRLAISKSGLSRVSGFSHSGFAHVGGLRSLVWAAFLVQPCLGKAAGPHFFGRPPFPQTSCCKPCACASPRPRASLKQSGDGGRLRRARQPRAAVDCR
jgi:hypothetical protein